MAAACDGAQISVTLTNSAGSVTSRTATLRVNPVPTAPVITQQPANQSILVGGTASFNVAYSGSPTPTTSWEINGTAYAPGTQFAQPITIGSSCTAFATLSVNSLEFSQVTLGCDGTTVAVTVSNASGSVRSRTATLTVSDGVNVGAPVSTGACFGGPAGWCFLQPAPQINLLTALAFDSSGSALNIVGTRGTVLSSADFGGTVTASWQTQRQDFTDLASPSPGRLVAAVQVSGQVGSEGLWLSTDSGQSWTRTDTGGALAVAFKDALVGVAIGGDRIRRTTDGGATWTDIPIPAFASGPPRGVAYAGNDVFVIVGPTPARSADGGLNWVAMPGAQVASTGLTDVVFNGQGVGLALNDQVAAVARTTDFGVTWTNVPLPFIASRAAFGGANTAVILNDQDSTHARSVDAGATWSAAGTSLRIGQQRWRPYMRNALQGIAVGNYGAILRTEDGGQSWLQVAGGNTNDTVYVIEPNPSRSVLLAQINSGTARSTDGRIWTLPSSGRVFATTNSIGWGSDTVALIASPIFGIWQTLDAGDNWTQVRPPNSNGLHTAVAMANEQIAVVGGYLIVSGVASSFVERTTDGGQTWSPVNIAGLTGTPTAPYVARFVSPTLGFIGGPNASLWRTSDAGQSWSRINLPNEGTTNQTDSVQAIRNGPGTSIFMATDSSVLRNTDGGLTWTRVLDNSDRGSMTDVRFLDANIGIAVGVSSLWRTSNGGTSWTRLDLPYQGLLLTAGWTPGGDALAGGDGGALLINSAQGALAVRPENRTFKQTLRLRPQTAVRPAATPRNGGRATTQKPAVTVAPRNPAATQRDVTLPPIKQRINGRWVTVKRPAVQVLAPQR
ncbi:hypothetical protein IP84_16575 [beta proteobacterium AAP99]|nr:hypothetical protein IP84_16575 [beta proteobacterium AAP99]